VGRDEGRGKKMGRNGRKEKKVEKEEGKTRKEKDGEKLRSRRLQCLLSHRCNLTCWPGFLAISGALSAVYYMQGRQSTCISMALWKKRPLLAQNHL